MRDLKEILYKIRLGAKRQEILDALGEPDEMGGKSRKYPHPACWKYYLGDGRDVQISFADSPKKADGGVYLVGLYSMYGHLTTLMTTREDNPERKFLKEIDKILMDVGMILSPHVEIFDVVKARSRLHDLRVAIEAHIGESGESVDDL